MISNELASLVDDCIHQRCSFAVYRIPGESVFRFVCQEDDRKVSVYTDVEALNGQSGFVIAPFHIAGDTPIVLIRAGEIELDYEDFSVGLFAKQKMNNPPSEMYSDKFRLFIKPLQEGRFDKLVLSRHVLHKRREIFSPLTAFLWACLRYTRSYVYVCYTPQTGMWLGSTPEIILAGEGREWHTVALAGTQPLVKDELPTSWDDKNLTEQRLVSKYIAGKLASLQIDASEEGPYTVRAGELAHLKSDFRFTLPANDHLGDLLKQLHPTPAVCGLPKAEAYRFILENEGYDRRYYSGFVGMLNPKGRSALYVNLRCMEIEDDDLILYAGGGLLPSSVLEEEWQETEDKLHTMRTII